MRKWCGVGVLTLSVVIPGCESERLLILDPEGPLGSNAASQGSTDSDDNERDVANVDDVDDVDDRGDVVVDNGDNTPNGVTCVSGASGTSWRDTLPPRPTASPMPSSLGGSDGDALAGCVGDPVTETGSSWGEAVSSTGHVSGRYYFEVNTLELDPEANISSAGVFAAPATPFDMGFGAPFQEEISAGGGAIADGVTSIAVDLDAGVVVVYTDGALSEVSTLALLPGVDAFHAAAAPWYGVNLSLNLGSAPFSFAPPEGFVAWNSNADGSGGPCVDEAPAPIARAPVVVTGDDGLGYEPTSYTTDAVSDVALVVLGAYDTGSVSNWQWAVDDDGNVTQEPVAGAHPGSALVTVNRPGPIALVLSVYEPTDWTVVVAPETELVSVSVYGMHAQTVAGVPAGVPVDVHSICADRNGGGNCDATTGEDFPIAAHQWPYDTGGGDTQGFIRFVERELCLPLKYFAGAYLARSFTVN